MSSNEWLVPGHEQDLPRPVRDSVLVRASVTAWRDSLVRNSVYLMATTTMTAALGFAFWVINAWLYTPSDVGTATPLISAVLFLSYISLFGLDSALVRLLPTSKDPDTEIGTAVAVVLVGSLGTAMIYLLSLPLIAPKLDFVRTSTGYALGFIVISAATSVNLLAYNIFVALRAARYNLFINGLLLSGTKLVLPFALLSLGAYGIFAAGGIASIAAFFACIVTLRRRFGIRPRVSIRTGGLRQTISFSTATYASACLNLAPTLAVPLIVLHTSDAAAAGSYFVAFQIANLLYTVSYSVGQATFAEGSHHERDFRTLSRRSALCILSLAVPAAALVAGTSRWLLLLFGPEYSERASGALAVLAVSTLAVAFFNWANILLMITRRLRMLIVANLVYALAIGIPSYAWAHRGLAWVALAWGVGNLLAGIVAVGALLQSVRPWSASHRERTHAAPRPEERPETSPSSSRNTSSDEHQ